MKLHEQYTTITGDLYQLFCTGKTFKTVITLRARTLKTGKAVPEHKIERRHRCLSYALNSSLRLEPSNTGVTS